MITIPYTASRTEMYATLARKSNKELKEVSQQLMADFDSKHRRYFLSSMGTILAMVGICFTVVMLSGSYFPDTHAVSYWVFYLGVSVVAPAITVGALSRFVSRRYWAWRGQHHRWVIAVDDITVERYNRNSSLT